MKTIQMRRVPVLLSILMVAVGLLLFIGLLNRQHDLIILCILVFGIVATLKLWSKVAGVWKHRITSPSTGTGSSQGKWLPSP